MPVHDAGALELPASVVTIGAFDGVHRGHQALVQRAVDRAEELGVPSVAYTFDPPPKAFFAGARVLTPVAEKVRRLDSLGLDHVVIARFDADYAARSVEDFLGELAALGPVEVWVGWDFRFGHAQAGGVEDLGTRFTTRVLDPIRCVRGEVVSSNRVRRLEAQGYLGEARVLLGWSA
jgi:FAD synthase